MCHQERKYQLSQWLHLIAMEEILANVVFLGLRNKHDDEISIESLKIKQYVKPSTIE